MATAPLTFAVEFATEAAEASLKGLTSTVGSAVQGIFGQLSPSNLVTQIAQQTLGVGGLAGNLVNGGVGAVANSRFGYLAEMGAGFNAENAAMGASISQIRQQTALGLAPTSEMEDSIWRVNLARFQAEERAELEFKRRHAAPIAQHDWDKALDNGSRAWMDSTRSSPFMAGVNEFGLGAGHTFASLFRGNFREAMGDWRELVGLHR